MDQRLYFANGRLLIGNHPAPNNEFNNIQMTAVMVAREITLQVIHMIVIACMNGCRRRIYENMGAITVAVTVLSLTKNSMVAKKFEIGHLSSSVLPAFSVGSQEKPCYVVFLCIFFPSINS